MPLGGTGEKVIEVKIVGQINPKERITVCLDYPDTIGTQVAIERAIKDAGLSEPLEVRAKHTVNPGAVPFAG